MITALIIFALIGATVATTAGASLSNDYLKSKDSYLLALAQMWMIVAVFCILMAGIVVAIAEISVLRASVERCVTLAAEDQP